jgi:hypothetical protein
MSEYKEFACQVFGLSLNNPEDEDKLYNLVKNAIKRNMMDEYMLFAAQVFGVKIHDEDDKKLLLDLIKSTQYQNNLLNLLI